MADAMRRVLFLQLPLLDNDTSAAHEDVMLAGQYLAHALRSAGETAFYDSCFLPAEADGLGDAALMDAVRRLDPAVIAFTLYLWNVERAIYLARRLRRDLPRARFIAGGPEAAWSHPFLFRSRVFDAVVVGEGETVFPPILRHWRGGGPAPSYAAVAWRQERGYAWGSRPAPAVDLRRALPPPQEGTRQPGTGGVGYLETTRGCPMRCAFCRYHHLRQGVQHLDAREALTRVERMAEAGVREIRLIDPTFNANPCFDAILQGLVAMNRGRELKFFAELQADRVTPRQAVRLARAGFAELEAGVQSTDAAVLKAIRRPTDAGKLEQGLRALTGEGIRVTVDVLYGLPFQTRKDVWESIRWAQRFRGSRVQCMQTLLLPGTDLRRRARRWGMAAARLPPYGVTSTPWLPREHIAEIERRLYESDRLPADTQTPRFVGRRLEGMFEELAPAGGTSGKIGQRNRRALVFEAEDLFGQRETISAAIRRALTEEPHALWQFILAPHTQEPLDLLDGLIKTIRGAPRLVSDRWAGALLSGRVASRRLFVRLPPGRRLAASWVRAAEDVLRTAFY